MQHLPSPPSLRIARHQDNRITFMTIFAWLLFFFSFLPTFQHVQHDEVSQANNNGYLTGEVSGNNVIGTNPTLI